MSLVDYYVYELNLNPFVHSNALVKMNPPNPFTSLGAHLTTPHQAFLPLVGLFSPLGCALPHHSPPIMSPKTNHM